MNNNELKKMANDMRKSAKGWEIMGSIFVGISICLIIGAILIAIIAII